MEPENLVVVIASCLYRGIQDKTIPPFVWCLKSLNESFISLFIALSPTELSLLYQ